MRTVVARQLLSVCRSSKKEKQNCFTTVEILPKDRRLLRRFVAGKRTNTTTAMTQYSHSCSPPPPLLFPSKNNNKVLVLQKAVTSLKWHEHFTGSCNNANDYWYLNWLEWHNIPRLVPRTASFFGIFSASDEWYWYEVVESAPTLRHWVPRV